METIIVVDKRNPVSIKKTAHNVSLMQDSTTGIVFLADWQFPVPAVKRQYFLRKLEFAVEECGEDPRTKLFQFSGILVARTHVR